MNILHVDSSITGERSVSRVLSRAVVERLIAGDPEATVTYRDLAARPIGHLTGGNLAGEAGGGPGDEPLGGPALKEFLAADVVVIGVGFYNFGIPSQLKAWVDRVLVAKHTFRYTDHGVEGLAGGKRVVLAIARGGFYGADTPRAAFEHAESYLRTVFGFAGIADVEVIAAEGIATGPDERERAIADALAGITTLPAARSPREAVAPA